MQRTFDRNRRFFLAELQGDTKEVRRLSDVSSHLINLPNNATPLRIVGAALADIPGIIIDLSIGIPAMSLRVIHQIGTGDFDSLIGYKGGNDKNNEDNQ